jgi:hypothetical protein
VQLLDILVRLPLAELLSRTIRGAHHPARRFRKRGGSPSFAAAGDVASVTKLAEDPIVDQWTWIRALAEGWRQTSDKELRARAGSDFSATIPRSTGKLLADDIESGRAVIPEMPDKQKIVDDLSVMATSAQHVACMARIAPLARRVDRRRRRRPGAPEAPRSLKASALLRKDEGGVEESRSRRVGHRVSIAFPQRGAAEATVAIDGIRR